VHQPLRVAASFATASGGGVVALCELDALGVIVGHASFALVVGAVDCAELDGPLGAGAPAAHATAVIERRGTMRLMPARSLVGIRARCAHPRTAPRSCRVTSRATRGRGSFMKWYFAVLTDCLTFGGRARRREFWTFMLVHAIVSVVLYVIERAAGLRSGAIGYLSSPYSYLMGLPILALTMRRLHDMGRSGKWVLLGLIPILGHLGLLVWCLQDGDPGANRFGPSPKKEGWDGMPVAQTAKTTGA
jgi:uncharacterized membrane protein YhaH (DUF805 family)